MYNELNTRLWIHKFFYWERQFRIISNLNTYKSSLNNDSDMKRSLVLSLKADNIEGKQQPPSSIIQWNKLLYQMTDCSYDD